MITNYSAVAEDCSSATCLALKSICYYIVISSSHPHLNARFPTEVDNSLGDDVIFSEIIHQSLNAFNRHKRPNHPSVQREKAINKGFCGLGAYINLVPFVVLFNIFSVQALNLLLCQLQADDFLRFACRNQNCKLFTKGCNVRALLCGQGVTPACTGSTTNRFMASSIVYILIFFISIQLRKSNEESLENGCRS